MATTEVFEFTGSSGTTLSGRLHLPPDDQLQRRGPMKRAVLLAHCFTCSKDLHTMTRLATGLSEAGYAALRFDFTGLGESDGDFASSSVSANIVDLTRAAASLLESNFVPCALIGHSLGGAASILATHRIKSVQSLVTLGAPSSTTHVKHLFSDDLHRFESEERIEVTIAGRSFELERGFVHDLHHHDPLVAAASLDRPHLVVHSRDDDIVPFTNAEELYAADPDRKRLHALDVGGHLFAPREAAEEVLAAILAWFEQTLS